MKGRNYGIDLLRIISTFMVVLLHVLDKGGILKATEFLSANYEIAQYIETAAYCAVNCFALISGYVGIDSKYKYTNIIKLYLQVVCLSIMIMVPFLIFDPTKVTLKFALKAFVPFLARSYWYYTAYFAMFFFIPFYNKLIDVLSESGQRRLMLLLIIFFSVVPTIRKYDLMVLKGGYSFLWLSVLYLIGAYIKRHRDSIKLSALKSLVGYVVCITVAWGVRYALEAHSFYENGKKINGNLLVKYTSPAMLFAAIFLLLLFSNIKVGKAGAKVIGFFAPISFGVYIVHLNALVLKTFINKKFTFVSDYPWYAEIAMIFLIAIAIFVLSAAVDEIRLMLFKVCRVDKFAAKIENVFKKAISAVGGALPPFSRVHGERASEDDR